jgi:mevalonate kinase
LKTFYSNGKLLITSEYVVLDGAIALALPTKFGQSLHIKDGENEIFQWKSYDSDASIWFEANIPFSSIVRKERLDDENNIKNKLIEILHEAFKLNSNFISNSKGYIVETELTFPKNWGLGTSSTLINNIAQWLEIDAFELLKNSFGGSGYDIACAQNDSGILYQLVNEKPIVNTIPFSPNFAENIYFVYLNKKQNSRDAIHNYINKRGNIYEFLPEFNTITNKIINADSVNSFSQLLEKHEILLSTILEQSTVKDLFFEDFDGVVKSLGAWGGDFVMAISKENPTPYFKSKGFETVLTYHEMIL